MVRQAKLQINVLREKSNLCRAVGTARAVWDLRLFLGVLLAGGEAGSLLLWGTTMEGSGVAMLSHGAFLRLRIMESQND